MTVMTENLSGLDLTECQMFLSYIPDDLITMNSGLRTLQFQDLQPNPSNPLGEAIGDLVPFDAASFTEGLLG